MEILLETAEVEIFNIESDEKLTTPLLLNRPCIVSNAWLVFFETYSKVVFILCERIFHFCRFFVFDPVFLLFGAYSL